MRSTVFIMALVVVFSWLHASTGESKDLQTEAVRAAESWLMLVDAGEYGQSWDRSAVLFKNALDRNSWKQSLNAARKPMGRMISREVVSARYTTSLPGAPDGEYVVIQFATRFRHKQNAVETVTPMKDPDGTWRVSGYFIK